MPKEITPETFEKFVQERRYLYNVSPNTEKLYRNAWGKWQKYGPDPQARLKIHRYPAFELPLLSLLL